jgi:hypothetical protein
METEDTRTPPDPRAQALPNPRAHNEDLRQRREHQPPLASMHPGRNSEPNARNVVGGARARALQVQQAVVVDANGPSQFVRTGQKIAVAAMLLCNLPEPTDPQQQELHRNIRTAGEKLRILPPARDLLPSRRVRLATAKPLSPPAARASTPGASRRRGFTAPRSGARRIAPPRCAAASGPTATHAASST